MLLMQGVEHFGTHLNGSVSSSEYPGLHSHESGALQIPFSHGFEQNGSHIFALEVTL